MSNQIVISSGAKVRDLNGVLTGTSGIVSSVPLGAANGVATLDSGGKVPVSQLPSSVVTYLGTWNAATNTPTLVNGTGDAGDMYICNVAGTVNFGAGPVTFAVGDWVLYGSGTWQKSNGQNGTVTSVAVTESGDALTITGSPITTAGTINIGFAGTSGQYVNGAGGLTTFPSLAGFVTSVTATAPLLSSGGTTPDLSIPAASASVDGYLDNADWTTFNNKQNAITLTTTGTSGVSTLVGSTLNIPNYSTDLSGYVPYTGATANVNLGTFDLTADVITGATGSFASSGGSDTFAINHSSGSGIALNITKGGNGEGLYINKTSGTGNAATIIGTLNATTLVKSGGTSSQFLKADGSVDASAYITLTSLSGGTGISYNNTTGVITNSAPDQTVSLTAGAGISISGTYPSFTIASTITQYTDALARAALSFTAGSGAYNSTTGVITIPTNNNQLTNGAGYITSSALSGYLPLAGGTLTGALSGTSATFTEEVSARNGNISIGLDATYSIPYMALGWGGRANANNKIYAARDATDGIIINSATGRGVVINTNGGATNALTLASSGAATFSSSVQVGSTATNTAGLIVRGGSSIGTASASSGQILVGQTSTYRLSLAYDDNTGYAYIDNLYDNVNSNIYIRTRTNGTPVNALTILGSGNVGIGVTPNTWAGTNVKALQVGRTSLAGSDTFGAWLSWNSYFDGGDKYIGAGTAGRYLIEGNEHVFSTAPSGSGAGAALTFTERMRITSGGLVRIGPVTDTDGTLQVRGWSQSTYAPTGYNGTGANLRLLPSSTGGTNITTGISFGIGGAAEAYIGAVQQSNNFADIVFQTYNGSGYGERMRITSGGKVNINNTSNTNYQLYVDGGSSPAFAAYSTSPNNQFKLAGTAPGLTISNTITSPTIGGALGACTSANDFITGTAAGDMILINQYTGNKLYITNYSGGVYLTQGATSWTANSDIRIKNINSNITNAVEKLSTLQTINFCYKDDISKKENLGLIAQEVEMVFPELIETNNDGILGVRYTELIPVLIEAIKEQQEQIKELKLELDKIKNK
jgi:hypothetical protein